MLWLIGFSASRCQDVYQTPIIRTIYRDTFIVTSASDRTETGTFAASQICIY